MHPQAWESQEMLSRSGTGRYQHYPMQGKEQSFVQTPPATIRISVHNSFEQHKSRESERLVCFGEVGFHPAVSQEAPGRAPQEVPAWSPAAAGTPSRTP